MSITPSTAARLFGRVLAESSPAAASRVVSTSACHDNSIVQDVMPLALQDKSCPIRRTLQSFGAIGAELLPQWGRGHHETPQTPYVAPQATPQAEVGPQPFSEVPGPKGLPVVGTLFDYFKKDGLRFDKMFEAYRQRSLEFGPIYKEKIGPIHSVIISDPDEYNKVIRSEGRFPNRREMEPLAFYRTQKGIGLGLVNSQGEEWHRHRTVVSKKMLKMKEILEYCQPMNDVSDDFVSRLEKVRGENREVPQLEKEIFKWAMESFGTFLFEERMGVLKDEIPKQAQSFLENLQGHFRCMQPLMYNLPIYKVWATKLWRQYEHYSDNIVSIGRSFVNKKLERIQAGDAAETGEKSAFLTYLLSQPTLSLDEVTGTAVDLLISALETTSTAATWCMYTLACHPEVQETLYQEVSRVVPPGAPISPEALANMPFVKAIVKETFRMYPITYATSRNIQQDTEIGGYVIPAGTHVQANVYGMYRNPELFEEPETFRPERWLRGNSDPKISALSNLIWGHGARMCIGRRLAEQELHIALAKIVQNFRLEYNHDPVIPILNTVMTPDRPLQIAFVPRH